MSVLGPRDPDQVLITQPGPHQRQEWALLNWPSDLEQIILVASLVSDWRPPGLRLITTLEN